MSQRGPARAHLAVVFLSALLVIATVPGAGSHASSGVLANTGQIGADTVLLDVELDSKGDATWELRYRVSLEDENATAAFESLERDVAANRSVYAEQFTRRIQGTVSTAENTTGRDMDVRNVSVRTSRQEIPQRYGVLIYSFTWSNFAAVEGSNITAGDAIGGLYLDSSTSLTVQWPSGYHVLSSDPSPDDSGDGSATWRGPTDFTTDQPLLVITSEQSTDGGGDERSPPTGLFAFAVLFALAAFGVGAWWYRNDFWGSEPPETESKPDPDGPSPGDLLSNEERVLRLLRQHGGRMKQQQVVEELDWTDAKTSQVVGNLRESGELEAFRLGRENVLRLPEAGEGPLDR